VGPPRTKFIAQRDLNIRNNCNKIDVITAFEIFEHFVNPLEDLEKIFSISHNVIFSTELLPNPVPKPNEWWYYGLEHGQHISFTQNKHYKRLQINLEYIVIHTTIFIFHLIKNKQISFEVCM